jgi:hypothetical protein
MISLNNHLGKKAAGEICIHSVEERRVEGRGLVVFMQIGGLTVDDLPLTTHSNEKSKGLFTRLSTAKTSQINTYFPLTTP